MPQPASNLHASDDAVKPHYIYTHRRATDGSVFYVGKGQGNRAFRAGKSRRNPHWHNVVNKHGFTTHIVMRFTNEKCALSFEVALIRHYGRENLVNKTTGGEGVSGVEVPKHVRDKISASLTGRFKGENSPNYGRVHTDQARLNNSLSKRGEKHPNYGKKRDPAIVAKVAAANMGKPKSKETIEKISRNRTGIMLGSDHHQYNPTVWVFHKEGCEPAICTRYELMTAHGLQNSNLSAMMQGRRKQCGGWSLIGKAESDE